MLLVLKGTGLQHAVASFNDATVSDSIVTVPKFTLSVGFSRF